MVMSAITVRANMRMMFDQGSANKMQTQYMGRLSSMEKAAQGKTQQINSNLLAQHKALVKSLEAENAAADAKLISQKKKITKQVAATAKSAMDALAPRKTKSAVASGEYKKQKREYDALLKAMDTANKKYAASAKALGLSAGAGKKFSSTMFLKNEAADRRQLIALQEQQLAKTKQGTKQRKAAKLILDEMRAAHKMMQEEERKHGALIAKNNKLMAQSQAFTNRGIAQNNARYREQAALLARINGSIQRMQMQLSGAFMNALMASGIALMSFAFRLQGLISTFQEFEKELMNAQSIFQTTNDTLYGLSDQIVDFGTKYGISLGTASEGLYTLASAGLSAAESQEVLANTLKLSMAVQGDHETIAKLTTQTIFGFGLEMSDSAELTDKFAHAINKSLIEYQDLASAVKFAMPFFITTGQNIDQLLGSLEILTNRALEAGIAGRGLRQALSEFAQHAEDNTAAFAKLGVQVTDSNGNFLMLTEIAKNFQTQFSHMANDTELLTTLLEDLNVRGATAFVHLVQNADEFEAAVNDLANSAGSATKMAEIQQQSLANQIQVVKNALMAPFLLSDEMGRATGTMNSFGGALHEIVQDFEAFFIQTAPDGTRNLTDMGAALRDTVLVTLQELGEMLKGLLVMFANMSNEGEGLGGVMHALLIPLKLVIKGINMLGEGGIQAIIMFKTMNAILPITESHTLANMMSTNLMNGAIKKNTYLMERNAKGQITKIVPAQKAVQASMRQTMMMQLGANMAMMAGILLINKTSKAYQTLGYILIALAGALTAASIGRAMFADAKFGSAGMIAAMAAGAIIFVGMAKLMQDAMKPPKMELPVPDAPMADLGMRMYDVGGKASLGGRHFPVMVEPGETIISKTQTMLGGGGITLNIGGDIVTNDADDFAERIAVALPEALRRQNDMGGI